MAIVIRLQNGRNKKDKCALEEGNWGMGAHLDTVLKTEGMAEKLDEGTTALTPAQWLPKPATI